MSLKCLLLLVMTSQIEAGYGGNDLFTSMEAMRRLWKEEKFFVKTLENIVQNMKEAIPQMEMYIENHKKLKLDQGEPNVEYLGHPINAYNFIKHSAVGWSQFHFVLNPKLNETMKNIEIVLQRENETMIPDHDEINGAAFGLAILHSQYDLNTTLLTQEGIVDTKLNMKRVKSEPSALKLSTYDLHHISIQAVAKNIFTTGIELSKAALNTIHPLEKEMPKEAFLQLFDEPPLNLTQLKIDSKLMLKLHDEKLLRHSSKGGGFHLFRKPQGMGLTKEQIKGITKREKKKFKYKRTDDMEDPLNFHGADRDHYEVESHRFQVEYQKELLCKGQTFRNASETKNLRSFYGHNGSPWLKLGPLKIEIQNHEPYIAVLRELMYPHECDNVTQALGPLLGQPPGSMATRGGKRLSKNDWTMKNAWPTEEFNPALEKMTRRVEHITNLWASSSKGESDKFMCGNYGIGGHYGTHPDYNKYTQTEEKINRVATVMSVLDAPEAGGATVWPFLGVYVFPEKGSAIWWFNTRSDSVPDVDTKHAACPVLLGQKWIGNKWIRYRSQNQNRPCHLTKFTRYQGVQPPKNDN